VRSALLYCGSTVGYPSNSLASCYVFVIRGFLPPNWGFTTPVKTCIANCDQTVPDTTAVCIVSLLEHTLP